MKRSIEIIRIGAGAILFAIAILLVLAAPGFFSDASSTVPLSAVEASR